MGRLSVVSRSGHYSSAKHPPGVHQRENGRLLIDIQQANRRRRGTSVVLGFGGAPIERDSLWEESCGPVAEAERDKG
jgi:hypothetical protein